MRRTGIISVLVLSVLLLPVRGSAQKQTKVLQYSCAKESWGISSSDLYQLSGIAPVSSDGTSYVFAVVSDKATGGGICFMSVMIGDDGSIIGTGLVPLEGTIASSLVRDPEGIVRVGDRFWVSGEADQKILEYDSMGYPTGNELEIPSSVGIDAIIGNQGFESLAYSERTGMLWTTTENSIKADMGSDPERGPLLRIWGFGKESLSSSECFLYHMDRPRMRKGSSGSIYAHGVSEMLCLDDGRLVLLEREVLVNASRLKAKSIFKLYTVDVEGTPSGEELQKTLLYSFSTGLKGFKFNLANFEGMCQITLPSGDKAILMVSDSQGRQSRKKAGITVSMSDYMMIIPL